MKLKFTKFEKRLIQYFSKLEAKRITRQNNNISEYVLPNFVLKRHIKIITNGEVVFDSKDYEDIPIPNSIQYTIKRYGYPDVIKPNNNTPLIYNITSTASSIFSSEEEQEYCMKSIREN